MQLDDGFLSLQTVPEVLKDVVQKAGQRLNDALSQADNVASMTKQPLPSRQWEALTESRREALTKVLAVSIFAVDTLARYPQWLAELEVTGELDATPNRRELQQWLHAALEDAEDETAMHRVLRRFRRARMLGIVWRDLNRPPGYTMWHTAQAVSQLAELCLEAALGWLEQFYATRWGVPAARVDGSPQRLVVLGMGKLGAGELNLSSDIDLIFAFSEKGETQGGRKPLEHQEYFTKLGQKLIAALDAMSADGFVFRVDMRLRPLGDGGPLVGSFSMLSSYYQDQGREWERYAMLKARPVAGDIEAGRELLSSLKPFVYRRYLDFGAIESLRELKAMINREVKRKGMQSNIKLGSGGIREVEFVVQAFQLIRGGRDTELQVTSLQTALKRLPDLGLLPQAVVDELLPDYAFLRDIEHVIQALEDRQTQMLPVDEIDQARVAFAMGYKDWAALLEQLDKVRERVRCHFDAVIADPEEDAEEANNENRLAPAQWRLIWRNELEQDEAIAYLRDAGFAEPDKILKRLQSLYQSRQVQGMQRIGFERLDALMPLLLAAVAENEKPDTALARVQPLIEAVLRRTAYLALLRENPQALEHLMRLCVASPWIAEQLARYPILLDELLTPETLYTPADKARLADELRQTLNRLPEDDEEAQLEALRVFKHAQMLHVAASDVAGTRHLMKVSDYLTYIAEVILDAVLAMAWKHATRKHGVPQGLNEHEPAFLVIGYGKLGGIELGYGSDLDLVFLHDSDGKGTTDGPRPIDTPLFFTRLGQRIIHLLTAVTPAGSLFEVDMRLRPSGNAGLLVTSLDAFADYQQQSAWTWEHQALVRARVVAGSEALAKRFDQIRGDILSRKRDTHTLREDVVKMRHKMRDHLGSKEPGKDFNLKHDAGGMVDIEFLCQYAVLALAHQTPELLVYSDNMRILDTLAESGHLPSGEAEQLKEAYLAYRSRTHRAALTGVKAVGKAEDFKAHRGAVGALWQRFLEPA
ncbi:bifunctional [glutamate--ammonia ligase]-adenylyl-L-tyrosine phosphorylase/[glutamate--ammonia-ligase] adenylyltransferase [Vreelandella populi]|uniref:Bifunctional glutamine synthetase adenylyltransferase/adenylyl-removing enzyme n=1 Tax=Vreelandella populi TaxID=2498858 RepID=A0A433L8Y6_9GAMM|nr:bifunctional [glutamate--ammonia ligase]-adenylyl-L-tyrosine phosphorylase/[glutamate--ammonia-ligase] adenylyltransferase [Halomonas populi]RUR36973.1 bifunctional [glutamate--ammonia ligase]-adenylyl-L-tyrosine phosphorylase/[glutamate--ammonia-ligase] adenylyltransferase [Halomonas populi]RUR44056.1 bifunctional [glutamate--ammonia ligase]-adenylyl-L-tyrosine phosphorylase/[glutamate--ammonia-ligase] adenylyltransferase [Halomonas populi]